MGFKHSNFYFVLEKAKRTDSTTFWYHNIESNNSSVDSVIVNNNYKFHLKC